MEEGFCQTGRLDKIVQVSKVLHSSFSPLIRAIVSSFEVVRPSGRVRLCLLVLVNVITFCHSQYIALVKLIKQS